MYYHRQLPPRRTREYLMPFLMILLLALILIMGWRMINNWFLSEPRDSALKRAFLTIEQGSVQAKAVDSEQWESVPDKIYLYQGEKLRTGADGRATLAFFNDDFIRLDKNSELHLTGLQEEDGADQIELTLFEGALWASVQGKEDPDAFFKLKTDLLDVTTREGVLAIENSGTVYMVEGSAQVAVKEKTFTLGVGQEFMIDKEGLEKLALNQEIEVIFAFSDAFKTSDFYQWNQVKAGAMAALQTTDQETATKTIETTVDLTSVSEEPLDPTDKTPPAQPQITEPGKNSETVTLAKAEAVIKGTVNADTGAVIINDYELQLYQPGNTNFSYTAKVAYGNLKAGENEYRVYARDKNNNLSEGALITLILPQEVAGAQAQEESDTPSASPLTLTESGGVQITEPNNGEDFTTTETEFDIKGIVPAGTFKVVVNDYPLSRFEPGKTTWTYKAYKSLGSLAIGQKNTYTVEAFNAEGSWLGRDTITLDVESEGAPEITIPTSRSSYLTTLNELVLGGFVGKWVQQIYINDQKLLNYIPGSEKWHHTVTLQPGVNTFRVQGESNGVKTVSDEIEITYQP